MRRRLTLWHGMSRAFAQVLDELRYEHAKRVRAVLVDVTFVDSTRAFLVWEPRRVVPSYAVPRDDLQAALQPVAGQVADDRPILDPRVPFAAHSTEGTSFDVVIPHRTLLPRRSPPATRLSTGWSCSTSTPSTPGTRRTSRSSGTRATRTTGSTSGTALGTCGSSWTGACSPRAPRRPWSSRPTCPPGSTCRGRTYGSSCGRASCAHTARTRARRTTGPSTARRTSSGSYEAPLPDAAGLEGLVAFYDDRVDVIVDGVVRPRPRPF